MEGVIAVFVTIIVLVYLRRALWQFPAPNMSVPVEESLGVLANYTSNELVVPGRGRQGNMRVVIYQYNYLCYTMYLFLLLSILLYYVAIYLLVCNGLMVEDDPVQEPIQCTTKTGNAVTAIGAKDYPPPAND